MDAFLPPNDADVVFDLRLERQLFCTFEVDLARLDPLVPRPLCPVEPRPGVGLLSLGVMGYLPGHFGGRPAFHEVVAAVHVAPDHSMPMPPARFALRAVRVYTDDAVFIAEKADRLGIPAERVPDLRVDWAADGSGADIFAKGAPLATLRNHHPEAAPVPGGFWGQHFTYRDGRLHRGAWSWSGTYFGHMRRGGPSRLDAHPFFEGFGRPGACFTYMYAAPGEHNVRFHALQPIPPRGSRAR